MSRAAPRAAVIYARISQDRLGEGLGTLRQLEDCRAEAERRGWPVVSEYVDDDVSAYSGKIRPGYRAKLDAISRGEVDAVLVWHMDRLHRRPIELEEFVQTCTRAGITNVVTLHGDVNLDKGDGLLMARLLAAVAANESDAKSRRQSRKMQQLAEQGRPHGGGVRPFGFAKDRLNHEPDEAQVIRELADRLLAGQTLTSVTAWLEESGVRTVTGKPWRTPTVRNLFAQPAHRWTTRTPRAGRRSGRVGTDHPRAEVSPDRRAPHQPSTAHQQVRTALPTLRTV